MANIAEMFQRAGASLQQFGVVQLEKEQREIESMRQKALEELRLQNQRELQAEHLSAEAAEREKDRQQRTMELAATEGAATGRLERELKGRKEIAGMEIGARNTADIMAAVERVNQNYTATVSNLEVTRRQFVLELAKLPKDPMTGAVDPEAVKTLKGMIADIDAQRQAAMQQRILDTNRITSGGYGKSGDYSAAEIASMTRGEKAPNVQPGAASPDAGGRYLPNSLFVTGASSLPTAAAPPTAPAPTTPASYTGPSEEPVDLFPRSTSPWQSLGRDASKIFGPPPMRGSLVR